MLHDFHMNSLKLSVSNILTKSNLFMAQLSAIMETVYHLLSTKEPMLDILPENKEI